MKYVFFTVMIFLSINVYSQDPIVYLIDFESPLFPWSDGTYEIDTTDTNNIWQVGSPQKVIFNQANSQPNVIVTGLINPYPINDTSSFILKFNYSNNDAIYITGAYQTDTDSLNDYGIIEISGDGGQTWMNISDTSSSLYSFSTLPILTGSSDGWKNFEMAFNPINIANTNIILFKFTFISDSIDTGHEGLMFDSFHYFPTTNTQNFYQLNNLKAFPNPTSNILNFQFDEPIDNAEIRIYSTIGQLMDNQTITNTDVQFDVSNWNKGMYYYGIFVEGNLVKQGQVLVEN